MISWKPVTETTPKNVHLLLYLPTFTEPTDFGEVTETCYIVVGRLGDKELVNSTNTPTFYSQCNIPERASISRPSNPSDECYNCHGTGLANDEGVCHVCNGSGKASSVPGTFR